MNKLSLDFHLSPKASSTASRAAPPGSLGLLGVPGHNITSVEPSNIGPEARVNIALVPGPLTLSGLLHPAP